MGRAPGVYVKKSRRETVPEVDDPDQQLDYADRFINKSLFRKIAHVQDYNLPHHNMPDPIRDDIYAKYVYHILHSQITNYLLDYSYGSCSNVGTISFVYQNVWNICN